MKVLKRAFTMIELVMVIVIMGIIGSFGTDFLAQAYESFIYSKINNEIQEQNNYATEFMSGRLQYRIKDSIIARKSDGNFDALSDASGDDYIGIEWVQTDMEGFRGITKPFWSGIIDLDAVEHNTTTLISPETNTTAINDHIIDPLSYGTKNISDAALYFIGANNDIDGYGWDANAITDQTKVIHPIKAGEEIYQFISNTPDGDFSGIDIYEFYKLTWTANALILDGENLYFYYNYQPWNGDKYSDGEKALLAEHVKTFRTMAIGSVIKIQLCIGSDLIKDGEYALCKEKTIF
jgi:prepilin-type N-terminal cleavage/methylation domain-containing protein